ncbi:MAG: hypothetical protein ACLFQV_09570 [Vulcanimicrobiota bacterium]
MSEELNEIESQEQETETGLAEVEQEEKQETPEKSPTQIALKNLAKAYKDLDKEEKMYLKELQGEIDKAAKADPSIDKQSEFCYGAIFAADKIKSEKFIRACRGYLKVTGS